MKSILVVEDVEPMLQLVGMVASGIPGFIVSGLAKNAVEARRESTLRRPDVVLLDEILPGESSLDLLRELTSAGIPVILMTGVEKPSHAVPPEALGRIMKPGWESMEEERERFTREIKALLS